MTSFRSVTPPGLLVSTTLALAAFAACGGKVELVPLAEGGGGAGGASGTGSGGAPTTSSSMTTTTSATTGSAMTTGPSMTTGTGMTTGPSMTSGTGMMGCALPGAPGAVEGCSASAGGGECDLAYCINGAAVYESKCKGNQCTCTYHSNMGAPDATCTCTTVGDACTGAPSGCCGF